MNKNFYTKLSDNLSGLFFVSKFRLAKIFVSENSDDELLKGVFLIKARSGVLVCTWFCPLIHFSYPSEPLTFLVFDGWGLGGESSGLISYYVNSELLSPKKDEDTLIKEVADYITQRVNDFDNVKTPNDLIKLLSIFPLSVSGVYRQLNFGLLHYCVGNKWVGEKIIRNSIESKEKYPLIEGDVEEFLSCLDMGEDKSKEYIEKMKIRNRQYLERFGFYMHK
ncbi:hypothetical protein [Shewanella sp. 1180_01]|uniref:hypothetical protein n=1 Tax=Shewanella sp. 1180_01 TaxID=2604451 RepID=UPI004062FEEC